MIDEMYIKMAFILWMFFCVVVVIPWMVLKSAKKWEIKAGEK